MSNHDPSDRPTPTGSLSTRQRVLGVMYQNEVDRKFMQELNKRFNIRFIDGEIYAKSE